MISFIFYYSFARWGKGAEWHKIRANLNELSLQSAILLTYLRKSFTRTHELYPSIWIITYLCT